MSVDRVLSTPATGVEFITYNNQTLSVKEWADSIGLSQNDIKHRYYRGLSLDEVFKKEVKLYKYNDEELSLEEWSKAVNVPLKTLEKRIKRKWPLDKVFSMPYHSEFNTYKKERLK